MYSLKIKFLSHIIWCEKKQKEKEKRVRGWKWQKKEKGKRMIQTTRMRKRNRMRRQMRKWVKIMSQSIWLTVWVNTILLVLILTHDIRSEGGDGEGMAQGESSEGVEHLPCPSSPWVEDVGASHDALLEAIPQSSLLLHSWATQCFSVEREILRCCSPLPSIHTNSTFIYSLTPREGRGKVKQDYCYIKFFQESFYFLSIFIPSIFQ